MQNAPSGTDDDFGAIVVDLIFLVEQVQASINLINGAIAQEASFGEANAANVICRTMSRRDI